MNITKEQKRVLITSAIAAVPLLIAIIFKMHWIIELILCLLSGVISCFELITPVKAAVKGKQFTDPLLLILLAGLLSIISGAFVPAALTFIIYRLAVVFVGDRYKSASFMAETRAELSSLNKFTAKMEDKPSLSKKLYKLADSYLPYAALILAVLYAVLVPLLTEVTVLTALKHAAVIIAVSGIFSMFATFTFIDFAAAVRAAECGVLFRQGALNRLAQAKLLYAGNDEPTEIGGIMVKASDPNVLTAKSVLFLAATAYSYSGGEAALRLAEAYGKPIDRSAVSEAQEINGLGVIAKIRGTTVCAGSAELMNRIGLAVMPFNDYGKAIHVGVNGRYAGRLYFKYEDISDDSFKQEAEKLGVYLFENASDIADKRGGEEFLAFASGRGFPTDILKDRDIRIIPGGFGDNADIYTSEETRRSLLNAFSFANNAELLKKGCFVFSGIVKALVLILALFGLMPLWLAVAADAAAALFVNNYSLRALDMACNL